VDGLKEEIRVVVLVHQPKNLESAVSLALLQEEAMEIWRKREPRRSETPFPFAKGNYRTMSSSTTTSTTPATAPRMPTIAEDKRGQEAARHASPAVSDDRASALKSYRKSRGLCFVCGEKWAPGHQCTPAVQLHVVQEMLEALGFDAHEDLPAEVPAQGELLVISEAALAGTEVANTFRLVGQI
jgi:hypothetical protein